MMKGEPCTKVKKKKEQKETIPFLANNYSNHIASTKQVTMH